MAPDADPMGISLFMKSPNVYRNLRSSGFINLPHENTVKAYLHFTNFEPGINAEILKLIGKEFEVITCESFQRNVAIVWDEMKISNGLIVSQGSGKLIGFVQSNNFSSALDDFVNLDKNSAKVPQVASHIIVFMVRGLMCKVNLPFLWYPCITCTSDDLYGCAWDATKALEDIGLKVRAWVCDGAMPNRKFFNIHQIPDSPGPVYFTENHFSYDENRRKIYFVCDPPHLLKTTRNNLENSHGNLN